MKGNSIIRTCMRWIVLVGLISVQACALGARDSSEFPFELQLTDSDLPLRWYRSWFGFPKYEAADARVIEFSGSTDKDKGHFLISHELIVYQAEVDSILAFHEFEERWFPTSNWKPREDLLFQPGESDDLYRLACLDVNINGNPIISCRYLQQHGRIISLILGNIDGEAISIEEFGTLLARLDGRIQASGY